MLVEASEKYARLRWSGDKNSPKNIAFAKEIRVESSQMQTKIRELFKFARIHRFKLQYGMNNKAVKGKELIITNYELPSDLIKG